MKGVYQALLPKLITKGMFIMKSLKLLCIVLIIIMLSSTTAFATEFNASSPSIKSLNSFATKYGVSISEKPKDIDVKFKFKDMREFEQFIATLQKNKIKKLNSNIESVVTPSAMKFSAMTTASSSVPTEYGTTTVTWWAGPNL